MNQSQPLPPHPVQKQRFQQLVSSLAQTPIAWVVLLLGFILTGFSWQYTRDTLKRETIAQLDNQIDEAMTGLDNRIQVYLNTFYAAKGLWVSENLVIPYEKWKVFVMALDLQNRYPGINGLGFIRYVPNHVPAYEQEVKKHHGGLEEVYHNYRVHPAGQRSNYFVIEYSEPLLKNFKAIGLDVGYEPVRRRGAERAIETGEPAATGRIILVQDEARTPGFLMYLPIYRPGLEINTVAKRRQAFFGFIYAPFRVIDLVDEGIPQSVRQNFDLVIYNGKDLIYGDAKERPTLKTNSESQYYRQVTLDVAGETWDLYFISKPHLKTSGDQLPQLVLGTGILITLLLFLIVWSLAAADRQSKAAKDAAEAANKAKSLFLANMSHELRTPLNAILGFTQIMNRDPSLEPEQLDNLGIISRSGEHLLALINDVLNMSKIEAGRIVLTERNVDLYELLNSLEEMVKITAESKGLDLDFICDSPVPQYIKIDDSKLRQILINLLGNAVKFTTQGQVSLRVKLVSKIEATSDEALVEFAVEDTGPGIAPEELTTLFDPFVQTQTGRKSQEGTGLGLAISQKFAQLLGSTITVHSTVGQGSIFRFVLPVTLTESSEIQLANSPHRVTGLAPNQPTYRILVVDDHWENRQVLLKLLQGVGFEVNEATNGQEAVNLCQEWQPHLVWMDMRMPLVNGYEATKQIKATEQGKAIVVIALTASAFAEERAFILSCGCNDCLHKPFQESAIFDKIAQYLGVNYIYEQSEINANTVESIKVKGEEFPTAEILVLQLSQMPQEWIAQLSQTAAQLNVKRTLLLIEQIPSDYPQLASALRVWVNEFRFDNITELTRNFS